MSSKIRSSYLEIIISFKPFNSTGAISLLNCSTVFSFQWALTHRSFPGILPDSSNFPGAILKFISMFDVRTNFHQSHAFSKINFKFFSSLVKPFLFFILPEYPSNFGGSRHHFQQVKTEEEFLLNPYPFFQRCVVQA